MCATVYRDELPRSFFQKLFGIIPKIEPLIAKEDIVCYKVYKNTDINGVVKSPYQNTLNIIGKPLPKVEIGIQKYHSFIEIFEGYHSFLQPNYSDFPGSIYKCIIPKGSTYYIGNYDKIRDNYISDQLIIIEPYKF